MLQFEPDDNMAEPQMFTVEPNEIEIIGFKGKKSDFALTMGTRLDTPNLDISKIDGSKVLKN